MDARTLRILLNTAAAAVTSMAGALVALDQPIAALALTNVATFLVGWANFSKPGQPPPPPKPTQPSEKDDTPPDGMGPA